MCRTFFAALLIIASASSSQAKESLGSVFALNEAYNRSAKKIRSDNRMLLINCAKPSAATCSYAITGSLAAVATKKDDGSGASSLVVMFGPDSDAFRFIEALGVAMITWSPSADQAERGLALSRFTDGIKKDEIRDIVVGEMRYRLGADRRSGLVVFSVTEK